MRVGPATYLSADVTTSGRLVIVALASLAVACGGSDDADLVTSAPVDVSAERCVVRLHGKGGDGQPTIVRDGIAEVTPTGNAEGWGARQWLYFPEDEYVAARDAVSEAIDEVGCQQVVINGFSNGGGFAGKLFCNGETFGGRLVGVVLDDPVPDTGTTNCQPQAGIKVALYWTGAQDPISQPGFDCAEIDGTCEGGVTVGIEAYAAAIGVGIQLSRFTEHEWYREAPELTAWLKPQGS